jgi:hypothetical protein
LGDARHGDEEVSSPDMMAIENSGKIGRGRLQDKLTRLYALRTDLDRDIEALQRTMDMMEGSSP